MKIYKFSTYISIVLLTITFFFSINCTFSNCLKNNEILIFMNSISLNIFASAIVLLSTSLISYFYERKKVMEGILNINSDFATNYRKIKYFKREYTKNFEKFTEDMKKSDIKIDNQNLKNLYQQLVKENKQKEKENLRKIIEFYMELRKKLVLSKMWDLYGELDFLLDINDKTKKYLYNNFFEFISNIHIEIGKYTSLFEEYLSDDNYNYEIVRGELEKLQKKIFKVTERNIEELKIERYLNTDIKRLNSFASVNSNAGKVYIYENIISEKLDMEYDKIWKIAYMKEDSKNK